MPCGSPFLTAVGPAAGGIPPVAAVLPSQARGNGSRVLRLRPLSLAQARCPRNGTNRLTQETVLKRSRRSHRAKPRCPQSGARRGIRGAAGKGRPTVEARPRSPIGHPELTVWAFSALAVPCPAEIPRRNHLGKCAIAAMRVDTVFDHLLTQTELQPKDVLSEFSQAERRQCRPGGADHNRRLGFAAIGRTN